MLTCLDCWTGGERCDALQSYHCNNLFISPPQPQKTIMDGKASRLYQAHSVEESVDMMFCHFLRTSYVHVFLSYYHMTCMCCRQDAIARCVVIRQRGLIRSLNVHVRQEALAAPITRLTRITCFLLHLSPA